MEEFTIPVRHFAAPRAVVPGTSRECGRVNRDCLPQAKAVLDSRQLRAALLQVAELAKIPVVVVGAFDSSALAALEIVRVFKKPMDIEALVSVVREPC